MKKILAIVTLTISSSVFAGSVTMEGMKLNTIAGNDQRNTNFTVSEDLNKTLSIHTQLSSTQTDNTNAVSTRLEAGVTATTTLVGTVKGYSKLAIGEKYSSSGQFTYFSVEPGVIVPLNQQVTARVGYRYRSAVNNANINNDTTDTVRIGLTYALSKRDALGVRYDRVTGDARQDGYALFYTRGF